MLQKQQKNYQNETLFKPKNRRDLLIKLRFHGYRCESGIFDPFNTGERSS